MISRERIDNFFNLTCAKTPMLTIFVAILVTICVVMIADRTIVGHYTEAEGVIVSADDKYFIEINSSGPSPISTDAICYVDNKSFSESCLFYGYVDDSMVFEILSGDNFDNVSTIRVSYRTENSSLLELILDGIW